jgi:hypothetical protein
MTPHDSALGEQGDRNISILRLGVKPDWGLRMPWSLQSAREGIKRKQELVLATFRPH